MKRNSALHSLVLLALSACAGADPSTGPGGSTGGGKTDDIGENGEVSFEEYRDSVYREPWEGGAFIVDGDTPIANERLLREYWAHNYTAPGALIVNTVQGADAFWDRTTASALRYCVSDEFGVQYEAVSTAMADATRAWEEVANVRFEHVTDEDGRCDERARGLRRTSSELPALPRAGFLPRRRARHARGAHRWDELQ